MSVEDAEAILDELSETDYSDRRSSASRPEGGPACARRAASRLWRHLDWGP